MSWLDGDEDVLRESYLRKVNARREPVFEEDYPAWAEWLFEQLFGKAMFAAALIIIVLVAAGVVQRGGQ